MTLAVEVFECEGCFSFLLEVHRFRFAIYRDFSLCVDVQPVACSTRILLEATEDYQEDVANTKLLAYDGRALVEMSRDGQDEGVYMVHFKLVQWVPEVQAIPTQVVKCIGRLSRKHGLSGRFVDIHASMEEALDFKLTPVAHRLVTSENLLHPLTPGQYELQGMTLAENSFVYECAVKLTLLANGTLFGTSRERPFRQECPLSGIWTRFGLTYRLEYEMQGSKHSYIYYGTPFQSCLHGTWENAKSLMLGTNSGTANSAAEHGILEFQLVQAIRVWSEAYHQDYPPVFRECVSLLLLASSRDGILPSHLWRSIVEYCGYNWFCCGTRKSLIEYETSSPVPP